jgi:hypothetical protein
MPFIAAGGGRLTYDMRLSSVMFYQYGAYISPLNAGRASCMLMGRLVRPRRMDLHVQSNTAPDEPCPNASKRGRLSYDIANRALNGIGETSVTVDSPRGTIRVG